MFNPIAHAARKLWIPFVRLSAAVALGFLGFLGILELTSALGFGGDQHTYRSVLVGGFFFTAGVIAFRKRQSMRRRIGVLLLASGLATAVWWFMPLGGTDGVSLRQAVRQRDELSAKISKLQPDDYASAGKLHHEWERLRINWPDLADGPRFDLWLWKDIAIDRLARRFEKTSSDDTPSAIKVWNDAVAFAEIFPRSYGEILSPGLMWIQRAIVTHALELTTIRYRDWDRFNLNTDARHTFADAFPISLASLIEIEEVWGLRSARDAIASARAAAESNLKQVRETCSDTEKQLLALNSLDTSPERFRDAREMLFDAAIESTESEIQSYIDKGRFAQAYGIARKLAVYWFATAEMLGPEQLKRLEELRDRCRDQGEVAEKAGEIPEEAPTPRILETAPAPRLKP